MDNEIKKKAKSFLKEYDLQNITLENLRSAIQKQGYTIVEYNNIFNDENVATLINALGLEAMCERSKGFTYADTKRRLVSFTKTFPMKKNGWSWLTKKDISTVIT